MCIVFLSFDYHSGYSLIILANRDEYCSRPTAPASWWPEHNILGAKDLLRGGTQFAVTKSGRFGVLTNFREAGDGYSPTSRGRLVTDFLLSNDSPEEYLKKIHANAKNYGGFNLLVGDPQDIWYYSNRNQSKQRPTQITKGEIYGVSNGLLDMKWWKVVRTDTKLSINLKQRRGIEQLKKTEDLSLEGLLVILRDTTKAPLEEVQETVMTQEFEHSLSGICCVPPILLDDQAFGTRGNYIFIIDNNKQATFLERARISEGEWQENRFSWTIN